MPDLSAIREELALELDRPDYDRRFGRAVFLIEQLVAAMIAEAAAKREPVRAHASRSGGSDATSTEAKAS